MQEPHGTKKSDDPANVESFREQLRQIVFEAETPAGRFFDIVLLWVIGLSVLAVMLESVEAISVQYHNILIATEWVFTVVFTIEYSLRIWLVRRPMRYVFSFYGIVDLLSCLPAYIQLVFAEANHFAVIRLLRLLRMFRVLKMVSHVRGGETIMQGLMASRAKITVFFFAMLIFAMIAGTLIYMVLSGYAIIAVPTGIVASDMVRQVLDSNHSSEACPGCGMHGHLTDAVYCRKCGEKLHD